MYVSVTSELSSGQSVLKCVSVINLDFASDHWLVSTITHTNPTPSIWPAAVSRAAKVDVMNSIKINDRQMGEFNFDTALKFTPSRINSSDGVVVV